MPKLLVIDDRDQTIEMCHRHLPQFDYVTRCGRAAPCQVCEERDKGCKLKCAHDHQEAAQALATGDGLPDLVVLDLHFALPEERLLPEDKGLLPADKTGRAAAVEELRRRQGLLILERLRRDYPTLPVILLTTTDAEILRTAGGSQDPLLYFCENEVVDSRTLAAEVTRALELHHTTQEGPIFWGRSKPMAELRRQLNTLARSPLPVLIEGETGTGKSFVAEHVIHPRSGSKGPLVVTDLSTVPSTLLPSHLFGARRGAYTGSTEDQPGVFEQAHGGTLFLDEIGNLDLELQRQLLLVLERGAVTRLGDTKPRPAIVKLVAATNMDVDDLVREGRFRSDLYMRLNPATRLRVPPLRERREDVPELVRFAFLEALRSEQLRPLVRQYLARFPTPDDFREAESTVAFGKPNARAARRDAFSLFLSKPALERLSSHAWPGNHRELRLFATNALVFSLVHHLDAQPRAGEERGPALLVIADHLIDRLLAGTSGTHGGGASRAAPLRASGKRPGRAVEIALRPASTFAEVSADVERQYLRALFDATSGDLDKMGHELLGPAGNKRKVHLRMNQLGLRLRELRADKSLDDTSAEEPAA